jgi:predicted enzyme related to lactoylglutathione lyase
MTEPFVRKVDCIRLYVSDLEAGLSFYRDKMGLALIWRTEQSVGLALPDDKTEIVLHTKPQCPEIDLKVNSADEAAVRIANAGGEVVVSPFDTQIGRCVVIRDPWKNELVLLDSSKGLLLTDEEGRVIGNQSSATTDH